MYSDGSYSLSLSFKRTDLSTGLRECDYIIGLIVPARDTGLNIVRRNQMLILLLVILLLMSVGSLPTWGHSRDWGYYPSGGLGLVVVVLLVLLLMGRL
jgi:Protein of unknown function (DUF3309)